MHDLDEATCVTGTDGRYTITLSSDWDIWGPNGGYLAAIVLRAAGEEAQIKTPASLYCHFLSVAQFDAVDVEVTVLKRGRRSESLSVAMRQQGKPILAAMVRTAAEAPGYDHHELTAPDVPRPEQLKSYDELFAGHGDGPPYPFWNNLESRPLQQDVSIEPEPGPPEVLQWNRFRPTACFDDLFVDAARSMVLMDTFGWPAAAQPYPNGPYIAPNLDVGIWFHDFSPRSAWLLSDHECRTAGRGLMGVTGRVWSEDGKLLATGGAQLCCVPAPAV